MLGEPLHWLSLLTDFAAFVNPIFVVQTSYCRDCRISMALHSCVFGCFQSFLHFTLKVKTLTKLSRAPVGDHKICPKGG